MFGLDQPSHWLVIILVFAVLFGYKKLPDMTRSVARSLRIFKTEMKGFTEDDAARDAHTAAQQTPALPAQPVVPPVVPPAPEPHVSTDNSAKSSD
jgi:sec-independent protein translocase protein TatA